MGFCKCNADSIVMRGKTDITLGVHIIEEYALLIFYFRDLIYNHFYFLINFLSFDI